MRYPIIKVRDKLTGHVHIVGTDTHDTLYIDKETGGIHYYNLQNGEGTGRNGDYEFVGVDNEFSPGTEIELVLVDQTEVQRLRSLLERLDSYIDFSEHLSPGDWGIEDVTGINSLFDEVREALDGHDWAYVGKNPVQICRKCKKLWWEAEKICPGTKAPEGDGNDCPGGWLGSIFLTR